MDTLDSLPHRQQSILRLLLHSEQGLTLDQLAQKLTISRNAVTQHINPLEKMQCINNHLLPSAGGRPCKAYSLTETGKALFPKQYALFSNMLLKTIGQKLPDHELKSLFSMIGENLALPFKERVQQSANNIEEVRQILEELGYETKEIDSTTKPSEIIAKNCVFHDVAVDNSTVCELDLSLISSLLDTKVEQKECMVKGGASCRFCISKS